MKVSKPYELLIRFDLAGAVAGCHFKEQSYYLDGEVPDLGTWREEPPQPALVQTPEVQALLTQSGAELQQQLDATRAQLEITAAALEVSEAEVSILRAKLPAKAA